jgi:peptidyl-prolyl cis-trans isomerase B (cyclophilin B)
MRYRRPVVVLAVLTAVMLCVVLPGCSNSSTSKTSQATKPKESTPMSTPSSTPGAKLGPDGKPLKTLADFPNDQDGANVEAVINTAKGDIVIQFFPDSAPITVANFVHLAREGFYNGTSFHRVVPGFVVQGGDPLSKNPNASNVGTGGPGYNIPGEFSARKHETGSVAMARSQSVDSGGSQFYICLAAQPSLDGQYAVFGQVVSGMDVVNQIVQGDVMNSVTIRPKSS